MSAFIRPKGPREAPYSLRTETTLKGINGISAMDNVRKLKKSVTKLDTIERESEQENFNIGQYLNTLPDNPPVFKAYKNIYTIDELKFRNNMSGDEQYDHIDKLTRVDADSYKNYSKDELYTFINILQNALKISEEWYRTLARTDTSYTKQLEKSIDYLSKQYEEIKKTNKEELKKSIDAELRNSNNKLIEENKRLKEILNDFCKD